MLSSLFAALASPSRAQASEANASVSVCLVPAQSCVQSIVAAIGSARQTISVQAYGFTSPSILTIQDVRSGEWGIGGQPLTTADVKALAAGKSVT